MGGVGISNLESTILHPKLKMLDYWSSLPDSNWHDTGY